MMNRNLNINIAYQLVTQSPTEARWGERDELTPATDICGVPLIENLQDKVWRTKHQIKELEGYISFGGENFRNPLDSQQSYIQISITGIDQYVDAAQASLTFHVFRSYVDSSITGERKLLMYLGDIQFGQHLSHSLTDFTLRDVYLIESDSYSKALSDMVNTNTFFTHFSPEVTYFNNDVKKGIVFVKGDAKKPQPVEFFINANK